MSLDFQRLERILAEAAAKGDAEERAAYLAQACGDDAELRAEVERLLAAHEKAGDFLETPFQPIPDKTKVVSESDIAIERTGAMIGRYKLLEEIGEGGFGVVYMAEQVEPVQRKVALKIIKAGMDTREVVARFEAERQALALMDHPNIAHVFDGGATQTGRPYFVMELVRGVAITDFCDQRKLSTRERLQLFVQVCQSVQHAHQKGIIHRDLKPSNILVTLIDGEAMPKIIDFGVAKALGQKLTEKTLFTGFLKMVGTPAYMSPEQADLSGVDIDTRSDIYSLGVLLYELLTGVTPFDAETLRRAALDEVRRMIRDTEPPKPSTRLQALGDRLGNVAKQRQTEPTALSRLVRGDLDWIVMKCLEKDRRRRYETANNLASDIERHLDHQPVSASPPDTLYRVGKFVRRHRVGVALGASVGAALVLGLVAALVGFAEARRERDHALMAEQQAQTEAARSAQVAQFMKDMLQGAGPSMAQGRDTTMLREILDKTAERLGTELTDQPEVELQLRDTLGFVYWDIGERAQAESMFRQSLELKRKVRGSEDVSVADTLHWIAELSGRAGQYAQAEAEERQALAIYEKQIGRQQAAVGVSLNNLGILLEFLGRPAEAETALREALAINKTLLHGEHREVGNSLSRLGQVFLKEDRLAEAEATLRDGAIVLKKVFAKQPTDAAARDQLVWTLSYLSETLSRQGKLAEAEIAMRECLAIRKKYFGEVHREVGGTFGALALLLQRQGKLPEAEAAWREDLEVERKLSGEENPLVANLLMSLGGVLRGERKEAEAEVCFREALAIRDQALGEGDHLTTDTLNALVESLLQQDKVQEAVDLWRKELARREQSLGSEHAEVGWISGTLAGLLWKQGKLAEAETFYRQALRIQRKTLPAGSLQVAALVGYIGALLRAQGKPAEAESLHREELVRLRSLVRDRDLPAETTLRMAEQMAGLGLSLRDQENYIEAAAAFRDALALFKNVHAEKDPAAIDSLLGLATVLIRQGKAAEAKPLVRQIAEGGKVEHLNELAWMLATDAAPNVRDGACAVLLAEQAVSGTSRTNAMYLDTLAAAYAANSQFTNAVRVQQEAIALGTNDEEKKEYGSRLSFFRQNLPYRNHGALATRATTLLQQGKFGEAELLARECLTLRENLIPDNWLTFNARSLLGGSLLGQKKYAEAEPLLVSGYEGMKQREDQIPPDFRTIRLKEALQRLVQLYEATGQSEKAAQWRQKLTETDKPEASKQADTP